MKHIFLILIFTLLGTTQAQASTEKLQLGCGWSDPVYNYIAATMNEKSKANIPIKSMGQESGRRLYIYNDNSWFLSLEFLSDQSVEKDVSCIAAIGNQDNIESVIDYEVNQLPEWKWGTKDRN